VRSSVSIPWPFREPLAQALADTAVGRPVTLGPSGEVVGSIVDAIAMTSIDPPRLVVAYEVEDQVARRDLDARSALSIDVVPGERINSAAYLPPWRVVA
jgi:hypothetical protein